MSKVQILVVEDEGLVARDIQGTLLNLGYAVPEIACSGEDAVQKVEENKPDLVLMDIVLQGEMDGISAAREIYSRFNVPVVYLTAHASEEVLKKAKATEPFGYIVKPFEERELKSVIEIALHKAEMERELVGNRDWFLTTLRSISDAVIATDMENCVKFMNRGAEDLTGWGQEEALGKQLKDIFRILDKQTGQKILMARDGTERNVDYQDSPIHDKENNVIGNVLVFLDNTERVRAEERQRKLEEQIQYMQKLESLGVLASGVAHDFNNLLLGIMANAGMALMTLPPESPARCRIEQIETVARRAAELTNQMLTYSGKGKFDMEAVDLSQLAGEMAEFLKAVISKKAVLDYDLADRLPPVKGDATQLRQVIMNLILNASEALDGKNGVISVRTGIMNADSAYLSETIMDGEMPEGFYVYAEVSDTGCGMDMETKKKIFDPFFTTKLTGRGLGLATALGIVRGHNGILKVSSEPGQGTTFRVMFPSAEKPKSKTPGKPERLSDWTGSGTILVVDDEEAIQDIVRQILERFGFTVLTASDGVEGLEVFSKHADEITAVLLDVTMPRMSGEEAFREIRKVKPDACVILSSGYTEQVASSRFGGEGISGFIKKPYGPFELIEKIKEILDL